MTRPDTVVQHCFVFFYLYLHELGLLNTKFCFFPLHTHCVEHNYTWELPVLLTVLHFPNSSAFTGTVGGLLSRYKGELFHFPDCDPGESDQQWFDQTLANLQASVALGN